MARYDYREVRRQNQKVLDKLQEGDLVEFTRGDRNSQWAVYVGDGDMVYLTARSGEASSGFFRVSASSNKVKSICKAQFWELAGDSKAERNNLKDSNQRPQTPSKISKNAISQLGEPSHNIRWRTDLDFATWCRYGKAEREQCQEEQRRSETRRHNKILLNQLEEGDLVEFKRSGLFSHWVVYVGDEEVVHLTDDGKVCSADFWEVADNCKGERNNCKDRQTQYRVYPPWEVASRAKSKIGQPPSYSLWSENCEHFATWCRYDKAESDQVNMLGLALSAVGVFALAWLKR